MPNPELAGFEPSSSASMLDIQAAQTDHAAREQLEVTPGDEPQFSVSTSYVRFDTLLLQFGLFGAATSRGARLDDAEVPNVICTDVSCVV